MFCQPNPTYAKKCNVMIECFQDPANNSPSKDAANFLLVPGVDRAAAEPAQLLRHEVRPRQRQVLRSQGNYCLDENKSTWVLCIRGGSISIDTTIPILSAFSPGAGSVAFCFAISD